MQKPNALFSIKHSTKNQFALSAQAYYGLDLSGFDSDTSDLELITVILDTDPNFDSEYYCENCADSDSNHETTGHYVHAYEHGIYLCLSHFPAYTQAIILDILT